MNNIRKIAIFLLLVFAGFYSCEEGARFEISSDDKIPPSAPVLDSVQPLPGGARVFYTLPPEKDVISIEASFTSTNGKLIKSAASFLAPYLEVFGLPDTLSHTFQLYALDRAGNKSANVDVPVKPLAPAYSEVANKLTVLPAFGSLQINWANDLGKDVIVSVDFSYSDNGAQRSFQQVYLSRKSVERRYINDLPHGGQVNVKVAVEDLYGNRSETLDMGQIQLLADVELDKSNWKLPDAGTNIGGKYMGYGYIVKGTNEKMIDGLIDYLPPFGAFDNYGCFEGEYWLNGINCNSFPWQVFIDLGAKYRLSRIRTHQAWRCSNPSTAKATDRFAFYGAVEPWENVSKFNIFWWDGNDDATVGEWKKIDETKIIPMPTADMTTVEIIRQAVAGDEFIMYPDAPDYTPPTRYLRYEPVGSFRNNGEGFLLSELTLYGLKAQ